MIDDAFLEAPVESHLLLDEKRRTLPVQCLLSIIELGEFNCIKLLDSDIIL
jgi:hypothetical protein